ncbi:hypothetical protein FRC09_002028 [Ceratobasidium sp. 395]|nr:hypothetical protein FRC09_002028 [Ceratobasidium sp. 395]
MADQQAQARAHQLNNDEADAGRTLKRKRVSIKTPYHRPAAKSGIPSATTRGAESRPGPSSGPSQNINGSEHIGRKAQEDFVTKTINSATNGHTGASQNTAPQEAEGAPSTGVAQGDAPSQSSTSMQRSAPVAADEVVVPQSAKGKSKAQVPPVPAPAPAPVPTPTPAPTPASVALPDDDDDDDVDMEDDSSDEVEGEEIRQLKQLYRSRPTRAMKDAFRSILEELSDDAEAEQDAGRFKRKKQAYKSDPNWAEDDDFICTDGPRRRDQRRVALSGYIRVVIDELLKISDKDKKLPPGPPPEVAAPTAAAFYFKWNESEKSEFNAIAARIVASQIIKEWPSLFELDEVFDMAQGHFKYLRACYKRQNVPEIVAKEGQRRRAANANTRKHTIYNQRLRIINTIPALRRYGRLIEALGIEGTSSDEEGTRRGVYSVRRKPQLSSNVEGLKRQLDQAFYIHFKGPGTKGNQVRHRKDEGLVSKRKFRVKGLPLSCMDPIWLATQTDVQKEMFEFIDHDYDFSFPVELLDAP